MRKRQPGERWSNRHCLTSSILAVASRTGVTKSRSSFFYFFTTRAWGFRPTPLFYPRKISFTTPYCSSPSSEFTRSPKKPLQTAGSTKWSSQAKKLSIFSLKIGTHSYPRFFLSCPERYRLLCSSVLDFEVRPRIANDANER